MLVDPSSAHELILEVLNDERVDDIDGVQIIWNGDGQLEITSPSGSRRDVQTITARHNPEEFADASCSRIRIDLTGPRDAASVEYKIRIASGAAFSLAAFALRDGVPVGQRGPLSRVLTINGGVAGEFSPSVASVSQRPVGDGVRVSLFGVLLNRVDDVRLLGRDSQIITPEWTAHGSDSITFQLPNDVAMRVRFVQARDSTGRGSVEPCDLRASVHPPVKNQILVRLHEGQSFDRLQAVAGVRDVDWAVRWAEMPGGARHDGAAEKYPQFALVNLAENGTVPEVLARMRARPEVYSADSLTEGELFATPNDPRWPYQWTLHSNAAKFCSDVPDPAFGGSLNANIAWDYPANGPPVPIGILDSGFHVDHHDFLGVPLGLPHMRSSLIPGFHPTLDPDPLLDAAAADQGAGHGTPVAGIAAGGTGFEEPYVPGHSTASVSQFGLPVSFKCAFSNGLTVPNVVQALASVTAQAGLVRIANMSFGFDVLSPTERTLMTSGLRQAFLAGVLLVAAVGNDGAQAVKYPAAIADPVTAVGAVDWHNNKWLNSSTLQGECPVVPFPTWGNNYGPWLDALAPGGVAVHAPSGGVIGTSTTSDNQSLPVAQSCVFCDGYPSARLAGFGGTSASAPAFSGAAAWLLHVMPDLTSEDAGEVLRRTAVDLSPAGFDIFSGYGSIDLERATKFLHRPGTPIQKVLVHSTIDSQSGLTVVDSTQVSIVLTNSPQPAQNGGGIAQPAVRYRLRGTGAYSGFSAQPDFWIRRASSLGMSDGGAWDHLERTPWAGVVGQVGLTATDVETYVYRLTSLDSATQDVFYPCAPELARVAFTALGEDTPLEVSSDAALAEQVRIEFRTANPGSRLDILVHHTGRRGETKAVVFDLQGRRVADLVPAASSNNTATMSWLGKDSRGLDVKAGAYLVRVERAGSVASRRFLYVR